MVLCVLRPQQGLESLRVRVGLMSPKRSEALAASILSHKATLQLLILHNSSFKTSSNYAQFVDLARQCQKLSHYGWHWAKKTFLKTARQGSAEFLSSLHINRLTTFDFSP